MTVVDIVPSDLPVARARRGRGYRIIRGKKAGVAHLAFHRRHQSAEELAIDVAEAQVRLYRRERERVVSFVWDLYGEPDNPLLEERTLKLGAKGLALASRCVYVRVNLRALRAEALLGSRQEGQSSQRGDEGSRRGGPGAAEPGAVIVASRAPLRPPRGRAGLLFR